MNKQKLLEHGEKLSPLKPHHTKGFKEPQFVQGFNAAVELLWPLVDTSFHVCDNEGLIREALTDLKTKLEKP